MVEQFIDYKFGDTSAAIIDMANSIIEEYGAKGFDLTLRQLYYQFVAKGLIKNEEKSYKRLGKVISNARLAGLIDWQAITDRTRHIVNPTAWESPSEIIEAAADGYRRDRWEGQKYSVDVWIEKEALIGVIIPICRKLDLNYFACRGYVSQSVQWQAAKRIEKTWYDDNRVPVILHLGDHDPSGIDMTRDIKERMILLSNNSEFFLRRIALNMDQIEEFQPPPNPAKLSDSRAKSYIEEYGYSSWELDALNPDYISEIIEKEANQYIDFEQRKKILAEEAEEKAKIIEISERFNEL